MDAKDQNLVEESKIVKQRAKVMIKQKSLGFYFNHGKDATNERRGKRLSLGDLKTQKTCRDEENLGALREIEDVDEEECDTNTSKDNSNFTGKEIVKNSAKFLPNHEMKSSVAGFENDKRLFENDDNDEGDALKNKLQSIKIDSSNSNKDENLTEKNMAAELRKYQSLSDEKDSTIGEVFSDDLIDSDEVKSSNGNGDVEKALSLKRNVRESFCVVFNKVNTFNRTKRSKSIFEDGMEPLFREDGERVYRFKERGSGGQKSRGPLQDFYQLRSKCLQEKILFEDPDFPANDSSLFTTQQFKKQMEWKRPSEISKNPHLFIQGFSRFDVHQGELGDCWLLAAVANLTLYRQLFYRVVPQDQSFITDYAGIFHFRFWQYGRWVDVVVDDRLPTYQGRLVFLHSSEKDEFWSALLEKAYAKLHGSYEALLGGCTSEAMEDFTGGITEKFEMASCPENLFNILLKGHQRGSLLGCSIKADPNVFEAKTPEGLIAGHAYSVTRVAIVDVKGAGDKEQLLRVRNPWGNEDEWNGKWSDKSSVWGSISESERDELNLTFDEDGEFWMCFEDFCKYFDTVEVCSLDPQAQIGSQPHLECTKRWGMNLFEGEWVRGVTAGGCRNYIETFWQNPQYTLTLTDADPDDEDGRCTVIVALMQKNRRSACLESLTIGFSIYKLDGPCDKPLPMEYFKRNVSLERSSCINLREVTARFKLPFGTYCIIPYTFDPSEEGEFIIRAFTDFSSSIFEENDEDIGMTEVDDRVINTAPVLPATQEEQLGRIFEEIAGPDREIDWLELKQILDHVVRKEMHGDGFSKDVCRSMVAMMDEDSSGNLSFEEFTTLLISIKRWTAVFKLYDPECSGRISESSLRDALHSAGYTLNNHILSTLAHRYRSREGFIAIDDFLMCAVRLKAMIDFFRACCDPDTYEATFNLENWLRRTVYS